MIDDGRPLFEQIAERIASGVLDGTYEEDAVVPSTNELARFVRVNPATAAKGLGLLVDRGVLYKRRGVGMFVAAGARERLVTERTRAFADEYITPMLREAARLGIGPNDLVALIQKESA